MANKNADREWISSCRLNALAFAPLFLNTGVNQGICSELDFKIKVAFVQDILQVSSRNATGLAVRWKNVPGSNVNLTT